jgi:hypothetical protein
MNEVLNAILIIGIILILPFIISFFVAMFLVNEMPTENRRPSSINDCFKCMFFDGYTDTQYWEWYHFFVAARCPIIGFITTVILGIGMCIVYVLCFIDKLLLYIPGVKKLTSFVSLSYSKIINYKFR